MDMQQTSGTVILERGNYRLQVDTALGGRLLSLDWRQPDGSWTALLEPVEPDNYAFNAGCFVMAPFANRLADGQFIFEGELVQFPINEPANHNAIHGLSRLSKGEIISQTRASLICKYPVHDAASGYLYDLIQSLQIDETGVNYGLEITHFGAKPRPYGIGLHPWFIRTPETQLSFTAACFFHRDERGLVTNTAPMSGHWDFTVPVSLRQLPWFDAHYSGWNNRMAVLTRPEDNLNIIVSASDTLKNLHIYVPDARNIVCIEPVSHVPDVQNKRYFAPMGDVSVLHCNQSLSGCMHIRVETI